MAVSSTPIILGTRWLCNENWVRNSLQLCRNLFLRRLRIGCVGLRREIGLPPTTAVCLFDSVEKSAALGVLRACGDPPHQARRRAARTRHTRASRLGFLRAAGGNAARRPRGLPRDGSQRVVPLRHHGRGEGSAPAGGGLPSDMSFLRARLGGWGSIPRKGVDGNGPGAPRGGAAGTSGLAGRGDLGIIPPCDISNTKESSILWRWARP